MRVEFLLNIGTNDYPQIPFEEIEKWKQGKQADVDDRTGQTLLARRHAIRIEIAPKAAAKKPVAVSIQESPPATAMGTFTAKEDAAKSTSAKPEKEAKPSGDKPQTTTSPKDKDK